MRKYRILIAEDSPTQAVALRTHLEDAGFDVTVTSDGGQALALLAEDASFDLVVSDVVMPVVDGYELCRGVNELDADIPVVLLTSLTDPMDVVRALEAGADNFLRKPYQPAELLNRIRSMLHNREIRASGRAQMGLELFFLGRRFMINSDREQILDLLVSTFEGLISVNGQLHAREAELERAHAELTHQLAETEREQQRLRAVLSAIPEGMAVIGADGRIIEANQNLADLIGVPTSDLCGRPFWEGIGFVDHAGQEIPMAEGFADVLASGEAQSMGTSFDLFVQRPDGRRFPAIGRVAPLMDGDSVIAGAVGMLEDIATLVAHDPVTGLPGHDVLVDRLRAAIESADRASGHAAAFVVILDRYDRVRKDLAPTQSDLVRSTFVSRLRAALDAEPRLAGVNATAAHLGPADIAIVVPEVESVGDAIVLGERLVEALRGPVVVDGVEVAVSTTVAVAVATNGADPTDVLASAATAARVASGEGGDRVTTTDPGLHAEVIDRLRAEQELRHAIDTGELTVHYQPQVRVHDGQPVGAEALVRWQHPARGLVGADVIVPLAVEAGLVAQLGWLVLSDACRQAARWRAELPGGARLMLSVNVAAEQFADPQVVEHVTSALTEAGLDPSGLILELTEGSVMSSTARVGDQLTALKATGIQIAIDDFGTGHSSLSRLRDLPADGLKIDRSFVAGMAEHDADAAIVAGTIRLARALGLEVVAEGVETAEQLVQLRVLGCDLAQGYHWAAAMPADEFEHWWRSRADSGRSGDSREKVLLDEDRDDSAIAYLVHELRSPLSAIIGFAEMLEGTSASPDLVEVILRNAWELEHRLAAVGEARDALEGRGLRLELAPVDVAHLVSVVAADLAPQLEPHRIDVELDIDGPAMAAADRGRLAQALTNLLTNAAKFSPDDAPIEVLVQADDTCVGVRVRDHGPGIPEHRRHELFRRFSRLGSRQKGMGIGLFLSRLVVDAHGGTLRYEPAPSGGACFVIQLPLVRVPAEAARHPAPVADDVSSAGGAVTVLYVEDVATNVEIVRAAVAAFPDVRILSADTGALGVELAGRHLPDLVLLDLNLPDMDGEEVLARLRDDPATADTPIVIASGDATPERARAVLELGASEIIPKPFDLDRLRRIVLRGAPREEGRQADQGRQTGVAAPPPLLDTAMVAALRELDESPERGNLRRLLSQFVDDADAYVREIEAGIAASNAEGVASAAHALAGASANFAAARLAQLCREVETSARRSELPDRAVVGQVAGALEEAVRELEVQLGVSVAEDEDDVG